MTIFSGPGYNYREDIECCAKCKYSITDQEGSMGCSFGVYIEIDGEVKKPTLYNLWSLDRDVSPCGICDQYNKKE